MSARSKPSSVSENGPHKDLVMWTSVLLFISALVMTVPSFIFTVDENRFNSLLITIPHAVIFGNGFFILTWVYCANIKTGYGFLVLDLLKLTGQNQKTVNTNHLNQIQRRFLTMVIMVGVFFSVFLGWTIGYEINHRDGQKLNYGQFNHLCAAYIVGTIIIMTVILQFLVCVAKVKKTVKDLSDPAAIKNTTGKTTGISGTFIFMFGGLTVLVFIFSVVLLLQALRVDTGFEMTGILVLFCLITLFLVVVLFLYIFKYDTFMVSDQEDIISGLLFHTSLCILNALYFISAAADGKGFGNTIPVYKPPPNQHPYFTTFQNQATINAGFIPVIIFIFVCLTHIYADSLPSSADALLNPTNNVADPYWATYFYLGLEILWVLVIFIVSINGMMGGDMVFSHFNTYSVAMIYVLGALFTVFSVSMAMAVMMSIGKATNGIPTWVSLATVKFAWVQVVYFVVLLVVYLIIDETYPQFGQYNANKTDLHDATSELSVGWYNFNFIQFVGAFVCLWIFVEIISICKIPVFTDNSAAGKIF
jgi:hypothetical protein